MAFTAKDGSEHTNMMTANRANARFDARPPEPAPQGGGDIMSDPKAMQLVDQLKQMGYTGEDVEKAMGDQEEPQPESRPQSSAPSGGGNQPISLPGL